MEAYNKFLSEAQIYKGSSKRATHVSMRGGNFHVPAEKHAIFLKLAFEAAPKMNHRNARSIIWRPPPQQHQLMTIDFDFRMTEDILIDTSEYVYLAERVCMVVAEHTTDEFGVVLTRKLRNYMKYDKNEKKRFFACGFHIYILGFLVTREVAVKIRKESFELIDAFKEQHPYIVNATDDIFDDKVSPVGKNGFLMLGDYKRAPNTGGSYHVVFRGLFTKTSFEKRVFYKPEETYKVASGLKGELYGWQAKDPDGWSKFGEEKTQPTIEAALSRPAKPPCLNNRQGVQNEGFNLKLFLDVTENHVPNNNEYKQIIFYCASLGMNRDCVTCLCNAAWSPSDPTETPKLFDKKRVGYDAISQGSMTWFLNQYATKEYDPDKMFPRRLFHYYNEAYQFSVAKGRVWEKTMLESFVRDVFSYSQKEDKFIFKNRVNSRDRAGNTYNIINTTIVDNQPFAGNDAMKALVHYTEAELMKKLEKRIPKKLNSDALRLVAFRDSLSRMTSKERLNALRDFLKLPPKKIQLGTILKEQHEDGYIRRFDMLTFKPYLDTDPF